MMAHNRPYVLSIAGFDPSAGAGVLADIKTMEANGVYGMAVVSALTWQNDMEFDKVEWVDVEKIKEQVGVLLRRFKIKYVKIGLIENVYALKDLVLFLRKHIEEPVIVYDPIIKASAGFMFHEKPDAFFGVFQRVYCITPNIPEAEWLFGTDNLHEQLEEQSEHVNIYLKGGHADEGTVTDLLYVKDHTYVFANDRLVKGTKHGSGCVLSAALTAQLALGNDLPTAAENANHYTYQFLASNETLLGYHKPIAQ